MKSFTYTCDYCKEDIGTEPNVKKGSIFIDHICITLNNERDKRYFIIADGDNRDGSMSLHFCSLKCFLRFLYFDLRTSECHVRERNEQEEINYLKALECVLGNKELTVLLVKIDSLEEEIERLKGELNNAKNNNNA